MTGLSGVLPYMPHCFPRQFNMVAQTKLLFERVDAGQAILGCGAPAEGRIRAPFLTSIVRLYSFGCR